MESDQPVSAALPLAITAVALVVVVYLATLMAGFLFRLFFIAAAAALGITVWRAWRAG
jgi:hypothetical protein